jgi:AbrB family looped-hinge helix DNA binding protein
MINGILSPKHQIVIPKQIRRPMDLKPGQRLQFIEKDGHL